MILWFCERKTHHINVLQIRGCPLLMQTAALGKMTLTLAADREAAPGTWRAQAAEAEQAARCHQARVFS